MSNSAFRLIKKQDVASLKICVHEYQHINTGAQHIHLASDNPENVFLVALRTVPEDSTGVAHILEHTALCGSKKYPVRDPFFMMTRRSINTFMNAFTSSDWTAYPFASVNEKDFFNLLDVYLDAVFFSRLDPLDFAQEGHRLEFAEMENPESELVYKGVVFNEMKGAMSSISSQLWHTMTRYLFPTTTYHYNSGGEPDCIPDLSYEQLLHFYKTHYHPSNATFMTYGNLDPAVLQEKFEAQALKHFKKLDKLIQVEECKRYYAPVRVQESYPCNEEDLSNKSHIVLAWLLGKSTNLEDSLRAQLLSSVLMDHSATPLTHALETSDLGSSPSPLCGLDDSQLELSFMCGLEGCKAENADEVENLIQQCLEKIAQDGIPQEDLESALHQLELHQREPGGDSYPYGLQLILTALNAVTHRGDPVALLNIDQTLEKLREEIKNPDFIKHQVKELLLDNPHRVRLSLTPDANMQARKELAEKLRLEKIKNQLTKEETQKIIEQSKNLAARQNQQDDAGVLPKVTIEDVPKLETAPSFKRFDTKNLSYFPTGTNGLVYQQLTFALPLLTPDLLTLLPYFGTAVTEVGLGQQSYLEIQRLQASISGGVSAFSSIRPGVDDQHANSAYYTFSGKALNRNQAALTDLLNRTITEARFDEFTRLKELVSQTRAAKEQSVTGSGHTLAMLAASSGVSASAKLNHDLSGLESIRSIKSLDKNLQNQSELERYAEKLKNISEVIPQGHTDLLLICEEDRFTHFEKTFTESVKGFNQEENAGFTLQKHQTSVQDAWLCNSQVNFCAKAYPTVALSHPDAAPLVVLGNLLRNAYLHKAIREQGGAYGGGASQDSNTGVFRFYSYRDPRLEETLNDFDESVQWVLETTIASEKIEEAVLGAVSALDKTESPAGRAKREYHALLHGRTLEVRQQFRERILKIGEEDLKRVANEYLRKEFANTAVICDISKKPQVEALGLRTQEL